MRSRGCAARPSLRARSSTAWPSGFAPAATLCHGPALLPPGTAGVCGSDLSRRDCVPTHPRSPRLKDPGAPPRVASGSNAALLARRRGDRVPAGARSAEVIDFIGYLSDPRIDSSGFATRCYRCYIGSHEQNDQSARAAKRLRRHPARRPGRPDDHHHAQWSTGRRVATHCSRAPFRAAGIDRRCVGARSARRRPPVSSGSRRRGRPVRRWLSRHEACSTHPW